jgi:hypothetical protein
MALLLLRVWFESQRKRNARQSKSQRSQSGLSITLKEKIMEMKVTKLDIQVPDASQITQEAHDVSELYLNCSHGRSVGVVIVAMAMALHQVVNATNIEENGNVLTYDQAIDSIQGMMKAVGEMKTGKKPHLSS